MRKHDITYSALEALLARAHDDVEAAHEAAVILNVDLWGGYDAESLNHSDLDECIEAMLDECHPTIPETLEVWGYRRMTVSPGEPDPEMMLERIYEDLDEEYNGGEEGSEPPKSVVEAAHALCDLIRSTYVPWNCDPAVKVTLDAEDVRRKIAEFWPGGVRPAPGDEGNDE